MTQFDMSLVQRGARLRRSPFYEAEQRYGPKGYTVYNHMLFPIAFDDLEAEYWHLLEHVTLWDVAVERCLEVSGPDGLRFTQLLTPRNLEQCAVGQAKYVLVTAPDGGSSTTPSSPGWTRTGSGSRSPRATCSSTPRGLRPRRDGRGAHGGRRLAAPDPGAEVQGRRARPLRRRDPRPQVLLVHRDRAVRHPGRRDPHRLDVRGRLRGLPLRLLAGHGALGADHGGRQAVRDEADGAVGHPAGRGRDLQLGRRLRPSTTTRSSSGSIGSSISTSTASRGTRFGASRRKA